MSYITLPALLPWRLASEVTSEACIASEAPSSIASDAGVQDNHADSATVCFYMLMSHLHQYQSSYDGSDQTLTTTSP